MRIGIMGGATEGPDGTLDGVVAFAKELEQRGFATFWMANIFGLDAITTLSIVGRETRSIELGTAVVPSYPRHPLAIGQQALTAGVAAHGRFTLGIGLSHKVVIEDMMGMSYERPARHMKEYLEVLAPLLRGEPVKHEGDQYRVAGALQVPQAQRVPLLVAALGPVMLGLTGRLADGTITWMTGPKTLTDHVVPTLERAAKEAGRPDPRVVAGIPVALTNAPAEAREHVAKALQVYGVLPSYRAMLDREGAKGPADIALLGDPSTVRDGIHRLRDSGVTDLDAAIVPVDADASARTLDFLQTLI